MSWHIALKVLEEIVKSIPVFTPYLRRDATLDQVEELLKKRKASDEQQINDLRQAVDMLDKLVKADSDIIKQQNVALGQMKSALGETVAAFGQMNSALDETAASIARLRILAYNAQWVWLVCPYWRPFFSGF